MPYIGWDNREHEDPECDNMRRDEAERKQEAKDPIDSMDVNALNKAIAESIFGFHGIRWSAGDWCGFPARDAKGVCLVNIPMYAGRGYSESVVEYFRSRWRTDNPEETFWNFVDCQECGWRVDILFSHHDGDIVFHSASDKSLGSAICKAALKEIGWTDAVQPEANDAL